MLIIRKLYLYIVFLNCLYSDVGSITGYVIDVDTHQPLIGANVLIDNTNLGSACDNQGRFKIDRIPVGSYIVTVSMIGYSSISRANINIYSQRQTSLKFHLNSISIKGEVVTVKSGYFEKAKDGVVSTQTIDSEEIRSDPIGSYDIQMMIHSLPSVITPTDQNNEIIVRGGGRGENLFIMDHLEIPNPNHFGEVGTGGGPVNIIHSEFVERVDFFAGGFPARYGDKQSSVMEISLREGSYDQFNFNFDISMAGAGILVEGPYANNKGSYIASYRKAFLKYIIKSAGLTSVPEYWSGQFKSVYNINSRNKLIFNMVGGWDDIIIEDEKRPDLNNAENVKYSGNQYTFGLTYKSLISQRGYMLFSFGKTTSSWLADVYSFQGKNKNIYFQRDNVESDNFFKGDLIYKIHHEIELSFGFNAKYGSYNMQEILDPDTIYFYYYPALGFNSSIEDYYKLIESDPDYTFIAHLDTFFEHKGLKINNLGSLWKYAVYNQIKWKRNKFTMNLGLRYDNVPKNNSSLLSPRLGFSWAYTPITKLNFALGRFYQTPFYWMLLNPNNPEMLKHSYTNQVIIGLEHLFSDQIKATIELYSKYHYNKPVYISDTTSDPFDSRLGFNDNGMGRSKGVEIFIQKKFAHKWYGTLSYSHSKSEGIDPRNDKGSYYSWDYDFKNTFTLVGGYKIKFRNFSWYKDFKNSTIFPYVSWLPFMVSDQLEISFRYRYSGGRPYTPKTYNHNYRIWYIDSEIELNGNRYSNYSRLDIMILRRFNFKKINITTYIDLQNVFNKDNEWERVYFDNGTYEMSYQYKQLPVGGVTIEF